MKQKYECEGKDKEYEIAFRINGIHRIKAKKYRVDIKIVKDRRLAIAVKSKSRRESTSVE